jgi:LmbE family N-acetylglucosaminyl deacetylase
VTHIFLSPHLDDAVLSCGGMIYQLTQARQPVQVISIFAGDPPPGPLAPFAHSLHDRWAGTVADRRAEDIASVTILGADAIHWPYPDAVYRRDPHTGTALYDSEGAIFGEVAPADAHTLASIAERLKAIDPAAKVYVPLTAGRHVDHQIVRAAAEALGREWVYYEDFPYVETPAKLDAVLRDPAWRPEVIALSDEAIRIKAHAIVAHRSQLSTFFAGEEEVAQRIRAYANRVGGQARPAERVWRLPSVPRVL